MATMRIQLEPIGIVKLLAVVLLSAAVYAGVLAKEDTGVVVESRERRTDQVTEGGVTLAMLGLVFIGISRVRGKAT